MHAIVLETYGNSMVVYRHLDALLTSFSILCMLCIFSPTFCSVNHSTFYRGNLMSASVANAYEQPTIVALQNHARSTIRRTCPASADATTQTIVETDLV